MLLVNNFTLYEATMSMLVLNEVRFIRLEPYYLSRRFVLLEVSTEYERANCTKYVENLRVFL